MPGHVTKDRLAIFEQCLEDGWSFHQIMKTHRCDWATLNRHFPGRGMSKTEGASLGAAARRLSLLERK